MSQEGYTAKMMNRMNELQEFNKSVLNNVYKGMETYRALMEF